MKKLLVCIILFLCSSLPGFAQSSPVSKGAWWVGGTFSFLSSKSERTSDIPYYNYEDKNRRTQIIITPKVSYFVSDRLFLGLTGEIKYLDYNESEWGMLLGPTLGYAFGEKNSTVHPFVSVSVLAENNNDDWDGGALVLGAGIISKLQDNIGITFNVDYYMVGTKGYQFNDINRISLGIGITGLLY